MTGHDFRAARESLGLTPTEVGSSLGVSARTVSRWESSEKAIPETAARLFRILHDVESQTE